MTTYAAASPTSGEAPASDTCDYGDGPNLSGHPTSAFLDALRQAQKSERAPRQAIAIDLHDLASCPAAQALRDRVFFFAAMVADDLLADLYALQHRAFVLLPRADQADNAIETARNRLRSRLAELVPVYGANMQSVAVERIHLRQQKRAVKDLLARVDRASSPVQASLYTNAAPSAADLASMLGERPSDVWQEYGREQPIARRRMSGLVERAGTEFLVSLRQLHLDGFDSDGQCGTETYIELARQMDGAVLAEIAQRADASALAHAGAVSANLTLANLEHPDLPRLTRRVDAQTGAPMRLEVHAREVAADPDAFERGIAALRQANAAAEIVLDGLLPSQLRLARDLSTCIDGVKIPAPEITEDTAKPILDAARWARHAGNDLIVTRLHDEVLAASIQDLGVELIQGVVPEHWLRRQAWVPSAA